MIIGSIVAKKHANSEFEEVPSRFSFPISLILLDWLLSFRFFFFDLAQGSLFLFPLVFLVHLNEIKEVGKAIKVQPVQSKF